MRNIKDIRPVSNLQDNLYHDYVGRLTEVGYEVGYYAREIIDIFLSNSSCDNSVLSEIKNFLLTRMDELICEDGMILEDFYKEAGKRGLLLCSPTDAIDFCTKLRVPGCEKLLIAMEPIKDSAGGVNILCITSNSDGAVLTTEYGNSKKYWPSDSVWLFKQKC